MSFWTEKGNDRIAKALEDIAAQLRYMNERAFPPIKPINYDAPTVKTVWSRKKPVDAA